MSQRSKLAHRNKYPTCFPLKQVLRWEPSYNTQSFLLTTETCTSARSSGFDERKICELRGTVHYARCMVKCTEDTFRARSFSSTRCPSCRSMTVPALLANGEENDTLRMQMRFLNGFVDHHTSEYHNMVILALGTSRDVLASETAYQFAQDFGVPLISVDTDRVEDFDDLPNACQIVFEDKVTKGMSALEDALKEARSA
jgi:NAD-dependent SIR2 family protein deacetylase